MTIGTPRSDGELFAPCTKYTTDAMKRERTAKVNQQHTNRPKNALSLISLLQQSLQQVHSCHKYQQVQIGALIGTHRVITETLAVEMMPTKHATK
jgi:ABC-type phosphate transport system permease subunit